MLGHKYKEQVEEVLDDDNLSLKEKVKVISIMMAAAYNAGEAKGLSGGS